MIAINPASIHKKKAHKFSAIMSPTNTKSLLIPKLEKKQRKKFEKILERIESEDYSTPTATEGHVDALAQLIKACFFKDDPKFWGRTFSLSEAIAHLSKKYRIEGDLKTAIENLEEAIESFEEKTDDAYHCEYEDWGFEENESEDTLEDAVKTFAEAFSEFLDRAQ